MYKCCDKEFEDEKSFKKHISSSYTHHLTSSDTIKLDLPLNSIESILLDKEKTCRLLGFVYLGDYAIIPLKISKINKPLGSILKRSLLVKVNGPSFNSGLIDYEFNSSNIKYKISFRLNKLGDSTRLTIIANFEAKLNYLGKILPGLVIKSLSSLYSPDDLIERINFLGNQKVIA
ncbi:hypothetical protein DFR86_10275 [Acidianus sulfidivorans JP7]|uniref:Uncharacterized protein n=1 Tax=Acidianus sulfidivorans JP7 TaxID=619593 RepID=A0A2U9IPI4_9CREN|nr:hypothetical protein [Acidianus sulfidivorans]AWR97884.1 hypothetical protein DFR86_10275 [Acidianus sulfidivorans JP7]